MIGLCMSSKDAGIMMLNQAAPGISRRGCLKPSSGRPGLHTTAWPTSWLTALAATLDAEPPRRWQRASRPFAKFIPKGSRTFPPVRVAPSARILCALGRGEASEVFQHVGDEQFSARVLRHRHRRKEAEQIASFLSSFEPCCGGAVTSRVSSSSCRFERDFPAPRCPGSGDRDPQAPRVRGRDAGGDQ